MSEPSARLVEALADRYRLDRQVGQGGMATVYLAHDVRHDRRVAVKVLRPELAAIIGGERFLAEIRTTANLQHPHILPLHDSGEADGSVFYVMPFVEGQSLRDRLEHEKQLPVDDAVRIAREVASALDYAHRKGIVHRDIKPENILLHDGQALVADFGIALAVSRSDGGTRMTETGMSLGTPHYMSPEQAMGEREISARADVYALGCVLYECLTGEPPFTGPTAQAVIARVMTDEPRRMQTQRRTIPPHVEAAVRTALEKLPADRFPTAAAFSEALANPGYTGSAAFAATHSAGTAESWNPRRWSLPTRVLAAATVLLAATTAWLASRGPATEQSPRPVVAFQAVDSTPLFLRPAVASTGAVAWVDRGVIHVRLPGATTVTRLPGVERADEAIAFSPDGAWLVFVNMPSSRVEGSRGALRRISLTGGGPQPISTELPAAPYEQIISATWADDGRIYVAAANIAERTGRVLRIHESGGRLDTVATFRGHYLVTDAALPGGRALMLTLVSAPSTENSRVVALDVARGDTVSVAAGAVSGQWSSTGHLLFARLDGTVHAMPFDARRLRPTGAATAVMDSVVTNQFAALYNVAPGGTLAYLRGPPLAQGGDEQRIVLVGLDGTVERLPLPPTDHGDGSISPDGRYLAYIRRDHVWVYDLDLGSHRQITDGGTGHHNPVWSSDGRRVAYRGSYEEGQAGDIYARDIADGAPHVRIGGTPRADNPAQWLADGSILSYTDAPNSDVHRIREGTQASATAVLNADWEERVPRVSPDGRWIAYQADEGGPMRTFVRRWPDLGGKTVVSGPVRESGVHCGWLNPRTLIYQEGQRLIAASIAPGAEFRVSGRRVIADSIAGPVVSIHPDGRRLLAFVQERQGAVAQVPARLIIVSNWDAALRARLNGGR